MWSSGLSFQGERRTAIPEGRRRQVGETRAGLMRGVDIGQADWYDIDTKADLEHAESLLGGRAESA